MKNKNNNDESMLNSVSHSLDTAKRILARLDCEYAEIRLSASKGTTISLSGEQVDTFSTGDTIGGSVRILINGAWGFVSFNDLRDIEGFVMRGLEIGKTIEARDKSRVCSYRPVVKDFKTDYQKDFTQISLEEKHHLIQRYNDILKSSSSIQTTRATYRDLHASYAYANSEGSAVTYDKYYCGISFSSIARNGSVIQPYHDSISGYGGFELVENLEETAERVVKIAVDLLKAESISGGTYDIVVDQKLAGVFIHEAFGHLSEADFVHENDQMKRIMVLGTRFGPEELHVIDDGSMDGLPGFIPIDDEGIPPHKTYLIEKGLLKGRLHSRETAEKMKEQPTGNSRAISVMRQPIVRMTNTYIDNGPLSKEDIFGSVRDGIYAINVIGGETNLEMFTFTSGYGYEIKNGKQGKIFKDIVLSGNVFKTLKDIAMIGNDKKMFGGLGGCGKGGQSPLPVSFGGPHLLIKNVLIGGRQ